MKKNNHVLGLLGGVVLAIVNNSYADIVNGEDAVNGNYPSVVRFVTLSISAKDKLKIATLEKDETIQVKPDASTCTGTYVSPTTILTAAHCVDNVHSIEGKPQIFIIGAPTVKVTQVLKNGYFDQFSSTAFDLALLQVDQPSAHYSPIAIHEPAVGETVTMVGFGLNDMSLQDAEKEGTADTDRGAGVKRIGHNQILLIGDSEKFSESAIAFVGPQTGLSPGTFIGLSSIGLGDSGGPLFNEKGHVIGVASRVVYMAPDAESKMDSSKPLLSVYVNILDSVGEQFFEFAEDQFDYDFSLAE